MRRRIPRSYVITSAVLGVLGLILGLAIRARRGSSGWLFLSDLMFA